LSSGGQFGDLRASRDVGPQFTASRFRVVRVPFLLADATAIVDDKTL
jgi:hypothetical protein